MLVNSIDNTTLWNEAAKAGAIFGGVSVGCLLLKELSALSGSVFLVQAAAIILWAVEFFGCILLMKNLMIRLSNKYGGLKMADTAKFGSRAALLSGLLVASVQTLIILNMPQDTMNTLIGELSGTLTSAQREQVEGMMDRLPLFTFIFQWLYCFLYGSLLARIMSRYIFMQNLFGGNLPPDSDNNQPDQQ